MIERMPAPGSASNRNMTLNNWFPNGSWSSLIFESTAWTIRNDKTISRPSSRQ